MENTILCHAARPAFFSARPILSSSDCETEILTPKRLCKKFETVRRSEPLKKRDCETPEFLRGLVFLRDHSPPLFIAGYFDEL